MAHGKDGDGIRVQAVQGDVATIAKVNRPFAVIVGEAFRWAANAGLQAQNLHALRNGLACALCGDGAFGAQEYENELEHENFPAAE